MTPPSASSRTLLSRLARLGRRRVAGGCLLVGALLAAAPLRAQDAADALGEAVQAQARELAIGSARPADGLRVEVELGQLDRRLKLAPCERIEPYLPAGYRAWGRTRVGLRCLQGAVKWNVFMPMTVKVYGIALVASNALPAGSVLSAADVGEAEVDLAAESAPVVTDPSRLVGRVLARSVMPGEALRQQHVRARQWFAAGDTVRLVAQGPGFAVQAEGQALSAGTEGAAVRVRTDSGRIVTGHATGERRVEVSL